MKIFTWLQDAVQSILKGVSRIFQPTDDDYPKSGVQPFEGEPYNERD
ncbi:MAG: isochorismate synthase [Xenococcaceae cyanobacterium MO_188.B32]|nr:isochorismate synthase [Xenococcaceae cyanobacterium MO_188.B32]